MYIIIIIVSTYSVFSLLFENLQMIFLLKWRNYQCVILLSGSSVNTVYTHTHTPAANPPEVSYYIYMRGTNAFVKETINMPLAIVCKAAIWFSQVPH